MRRWLIASAALAFVLASVPSSAAAQVRGVAVEAYRGQRPPEADRPMNILLRELEKLGVVAHPPMIQERLGGRLPRPGLRPQKPPSLSQLYRQLDTAVNMWVSRQHDTSKTVAALEDALAAAFENLALVVTDPSQRSKLRRAMLSLSLAYDALAHDPSFASQAVAHGRASLEWMAELIRTFPQDAVTTNPHGPVAEQLYVTARDDLDKRGRGTLTISCTDPNVQLYVNEAIRQPGKTLLDLMPGRYRVLIIGPGNVSRWYAVQVLPRQSAVLQIDWDVDASLAIGLFTVSFVVPVNAPEDREVELARKLARRLSAEPGVFVLSLTTIGARPAVIATLHSVATGKVIRRASAILGPGDEARLRTLASFLVKGSTADGVIVDVTADLSAADLGAVPAVSPPAPAATMVSSPRSLRARHPYRKWVVAAAATITLAGSAALFYVDEKGYCGQPQDVLCPEVLETTAGAYTSLAIGIGLAGLAGYYFISDRGPAGASVSAAPTAGGAMVTIGGTF
jgi:hypothetical protein